MMRAPWLALPLVFVAASGCGEERSRRGPTARERVDGGSWDGADNARGEVRPAPEIDGPAPSGPGCDDPVAVSDECCGLARGQGPLEATTAISRLSNSTLTLTLVDLDEESDGPAWLLKIPA